MSSASRHAVVKDLAEEAKKRIVILVICVIGLSYLMSLTSSSVWVNLPAAAALIIALRYFSLDIDLRRKTAAYDNKPPPANALLKKQPFQRPKIIKKSDWRIKVDSPVVEDAIDHLTKHIVSEWVTDLWYSRITPDKEGPEELVCIINGVLAEISDRARTINLIDLLTRDVINIFCNHLDNFRLSLVKIEKQQSEPITIENQDKALRHILASENKLHPALFSAEAEHKVLQHVMDGLISIAFKPEDLQCCFFRYVVRELLACTVIRPVINLVNPRFINERIESVVISRMKNEKGTTASQDASQPKTGPSRVSADHFSRVFDPSATGVELVQLKNTLPSRDKPEADNGTSLSKDPLLSMDARTSRSWNSVTDELPNGDDINLQRHSSGGEWGEVLDKISRRKAQALAPEHFENVWTKGKNYRKKDGDNHLIIEQVPQHSSARSSASTDHLNSTPKPPRKDVIVKNTLPRVNTRGLDSSGTSPIHSSRKVACGIQEEDAQKLMPLAEADSESTSYTSDEDEGTDAVTGLGSPGTRVWDARSKKNSASRIHHPLEPIEGNFAKKTRKEQSRYQRLHNQSGRKRTRPRSKIGLWQEVDRTSFLSGDGQDILRSPKDYGNDDSSSDDTDDEILGRANSGTMASSSSAYSLSVSGHNSNVNSPQNSMVLDSFLKLRCEVLGANVVKSDSKMFAVYSISVTDANNNCWSVKRRFRHFEELHRRLKYFPEYNLHLPPKHFLSTGLDVPIIQERSRLHDIYLKRVMQLPRISGSIEVWDFLSVDSQTYYFSNSFSIIETLSVNLEDKAPERINKVSTVAGPTLTPLSSKRETVAPDVKETALRIKQNPKPDGLRVNAKANANSTGGNDVTQETPLDASSDPTLPTEWIPPNLSAPLLDLVDVIFQLQDGGWIRRKAFWVAKQVLHLGMSDAFDDWLIEKIQLLRRGSVVASGIKKLEQILWPDGIFITKHPKQQRPPPQPENSQQSPKSPTAEISSPRLTDEQQQEAAEQRAKFVYEIMIDKAPAAIVSLVGHREYEQSAKDLYFFLQSSVCIKLLAFELLELLLLSAFPELEDTFKHLHEEKHKFGEYQDV